MKLKQLMRYFFLSAFFAFSFFVAQSFPFHHSKNSKLSSFHALTNFSNDASSAINYDDTMFDVEDDSDNYDSNENDAKVKPSLHNFHFLSHKILFNKIGFYSESYFSFAVSLHDSARLSVFRI